jgi:hypothetical protein
MSVTVSRSKDYEDQHPKTSFDSTESATVLTQDRIAEALKAAHTAVVNSKTPEEKAYHEGNAEKLADAWVKAKPAETTFGGAQGALIRGMAPIAAGTLAGAGAGMIMGGPPGALAGAAGGAALTGAEELAGGVYNLARRPVNAAINYFRGKPAEQNFQLPEYPGISGIIDPILTEMGVPKPDTYTEKMIGALAGGVNAKSIADALGATVKHIPTGAVRKTTQIMSQMPTRQGVSATLAQGTGVTVDELKKQGDLGMAQPIVDVAAPFAVGALPFVVRGGAPTRQAFAAMERGFKVPPAQTSDKPSLLSRATETIGGREATRQQASVANEKIAAQKIRQDFGIADNAPITRDELSRARSQEGPIYETAKQLPANDSFKSIQGFSQKISDIIKPYAEAKKESPGFVSQNNDLDNLVQQAQDIATKVGSGGRYSSRAAVESSQTLRADANKNMLSEDPRTVRLGQAQRKVAMALEELVANRSPDASFKQSWNNARIKIAKSYAVEDALIGDTGQIDAAVLGRSHSKGNVFTGGVGEVASTASAFPEAMRARPYQPPMARFSPSDALYVLPEAGEQAAAHMGVDTGTNYGATALALGAAAKAAPPLARALALSGLYQRGLKGSIAKKGDTLRALTAMGPTVIKRDSPDKDKNP